MVQKEKPQSLSCGEYHLRQVSDRIFFRKDWFAQTSGPKGSEAVKTYNARERSDRAEGVTLGSGDPITPSKTKHSAGEYKYPQVLITFRGTTTWALEKTEKVSLYTNR